MPEYKGISGLRPVRRAPGSRLFALTFSLLLALAYAALAEEANPEAGPSATSLPKMESDRGSGENVTPKEVRPALARRKKNALNQFDPKVFEARGRELQGEYYEIDGMAKASSWNASGARSDAASATAGERKNSSSNHWMIWTGAAGLAAVVGGAVGYLMLDQHTAPEPLPVHLTDKPNNQP